jgi:hypothetical protein
MNLQEKTQNKIQMQFPPATEYTAAVHCPICTHTVQGTVVAQSRSLRVKPGQKCSRCSASLDPGYVLRYDRAA